VTMAAARATAEGPECLKALLSTPLPKGRLDLHQPVKDGKTALMIVSNNNHPDLVKLLLENGASASGFDAEGVTALMHAINGACISCARDILNTESGAAIVNARDLKGWTALMLASRVKFGEELIAPLLAAGADPNAYKEDGMTSLMLAAGQNRSATITALLDAGADPTMEDAQKWTALHIAASRDFAEPVTLLLEAGASQTAKNEEQETPLGHAVDNGRGLAIQAFRLYNGEAIKQNPVLEVNSKTFKEVVGGDRPVLMQFYAPWCDHCKKFAHVYDEVARSLSVADEIVVAKADAATDAKLAGAHNVEVFPTIKWFPKKSLEGDMWKGARIYDAVMHFVDSKHKL